MGVQAPPGESKAPPTHHEESHDGGGGSGGASTGFGHESTRPTFARGGTGTAGAVERASESGTTVNVMLAAYHDIAAG